MGGLLAIDACVRILSGRSVADGFSNLYDTMLKLVNLDKDGQKALVEAIKQKISAYWNYPSDDKLTWVKELLGIKDIAFR